VAAADLDLRAAALALRDLTSSAEIFPLPADPAKLRRAWLLLSGVVRRESFWERWFNAPPMMSRLHDLRGGFDLVHVDSVVLAAYRAALPDAPVVLSHHNIESVLVRQRSNAARFGVVRRLLRREASKVETLERRWAPQVTLNLVVSELDRTRLLNVATAAEAEVVPNGVDTTYFRADPQVASHRSTLVFVGGMDWYPNRDAMVFFAREIWPLLASRNPRRHAIIIGRNPPGELAALRDSRVEVAGFVSDVRPVVSRASIFICPMRIGGGTRVKILDALSMSRALVSTDLGVEGLSLEPETHFLRANSPEEFERQISRLEEDDELRLRLGRAGRTMVENRFSWDVVGRALLRSYERASGSRVASMKETSAQPPA
jgi:glycosyltransferase involved in cell wall biosynthesis